LEALKITNKMTGKMEGMISLNTSSLNNKFCIAMAKKDLICSKCYSNQMLKMYKNADAAFQHNGRLLSEGKLEDLPRFNAAFVRFNAFGELINDSHMYNLIKICEHNPNTTFTLWTKKKGIVIKMLGQYGKPKNLLLVYSSEEVGVRELLPLYFDKVFTVYGKVSKIDINCGDKKCFDCRLCYTKNRTIYIKERIK